MRCHTASNKALFITMKIENVSPFAANIIKQEMLGKGGDVAVNSVQLQRPDSDILIMEPTQYNKLIYKLEMQPEALRRLERK